MDLLGTEFYAGLPAIQELKVPGEGLDIAYLHRWASRLRLADLLARAFYQTDGNEVVSVAHSTRGRTIDDPPRR